MSLEGGALKTFLGFPDVSFCLTGLTDNANQKIHQLWDLIIIQPIGRKRVPIEGGISKLVAYGDQQMPETPIRVARITKSSGEFVQKKEWGEYAHKNYLRAREGAKQVASDLRFHAVADLHWQETDDCEGSYFLWVLRRFRK